MIPETEENKVEIDSDIFEKLDSGLQRAFDNCVSKTNYSYAEHRGEGPRSRRKRQCADAATRRI